mgnify:CR=1 FL=1
MTLFSRWSCQVRDKWKQHILWKYDEKKSHSIKIRCKYLHNPFYKIIVVDYNSHCNFKPSSDDFIRQYQPNTLLGNHTTLTLIEPTAERIRNLLEIIRSREEKYQSLLETFNVFNMANPMKSLKTYTNETNIDEIKLLYNRFIKLMPNSNKIEINSTFIDYLRRISSYLSDGLRHKRTNKVDQEHCSSFL